MAKKKPKRNATKRQIRSSKKQAAGKKKSGKPKTNKRPARISKKPQPQKPKTRKAAKAVKPKKKVGKPAQNITDQIIKRFTDKKTGRLRMRKADGKFVSKEAQEAILKAARELDKRRIPFTYEELLGVPQIADLMLVIEDETPRELFYWNVLALIDSAKNSIVNSHTKYTIVNLRGLESKHDKKKDAARIALSQSEILSKVEQLAKADGLGNLYITIAVWLTENVNDDVLRMRIDFTKAKGNLPNEELWKYINRALGEPAEPQTEPAAKENEPEEIHTKEPRAKKDRSAGKGKGKGESKKKKSGSSGKRNTRGKGSKRGGGPKKEKEKNNRKKRR